MHKLRIYVDTSVFGGVGDEEFSESSSRFLEWVKEGRYVILVSEITYRELRDAPEATQRVLKELPPESLEEIVIDAEVEELADAYIAAKALGAAARADAMHVAAATVAGADLILSWNFKHIVNFNRIRAFNSVNLVKKYRLIDIRSPLEMNDDDENEDI